ncbi:MAG: LysR family substrate-binding domain-containing protein, partial [Pseudolabrys sp.]
FNEKLPGVLFNLFHMDTFTQMKGVADGSLDVGFIRKPEHYTSGLAGFVVCRRHFWAAIPKNHPLAANDVIRPASLADEKFVALTVELEAGMWVNISAVTPPSSSTQVTQRAADTFTLLTMVGAGIGLCIVPEQLARLDIPGVVFRRIAGASRMAEIAVVHRKNEADRAVKAYIESLRKMRDR